MAKMTKIGKILRDLEAEKAGVQARAAADVAVLDAVIKRVRATQTPMAKRAPAVPPNREVRDGDAPSTRRAKDLARPVNIPTAIATA